MNAAHLRALAHSRFISLLMNRPKDDQRTHDTLRKQAAREIIAEARSNRSTAPISSTASSGFELVFQKLWAICCRMNHFADMERRSFSARARKPEPTITDNPIITDEPVSVSARAENENVVSLPVVTASGKQSIPDSEFAARYHDQATSNWRASIQQNESINKLRAEASARHRQTTARYFG